MSRRLPEHQRRRVVELLAAGLSHRKIARRTGVSLPTIGKLARGDRPAPDDHDEPLARQMLAARRCGGCGGRVFVWPCLYCAMYEPTPKRRTAAATIRQQ